MKNSNKKGFTIVELVIVIAVIAILAAVLIPTFSGLVKKANLSSDQQAVREINQALAVDQAKNGVPKNVDAAMSIIAKAGYDIASYKPLTSNLEIYWVDTINRVILFDRAKGKVIYPEDRVSLTNDGSWHPFNESYLDAISIKFDTKVDAGSFNGENSFTKLVAGESQSVQVKLTYTKSGETISNPTFSIIKPASYNAGTSQAIIEEKKAGKYLYSIVTQYNEKLLTGADGNVTSNINIELPSDMPIDISDYDWKPIKNFHGSIKGSENKEAVIKGLTLTENSSYTGTVCFDGSGASGYNATGFIASIIEGEVSNLKFEDVSVNMPCLDYTKVYPDNYNANVFAVISAIIPDFNSNDDSQHSVTVKNITVENGSVTSFARVGGIVGYIGGSGTKHLTSATVNISDCTVKNLTVKAGLKLDLKTKKGTHPNYGSIGGMVSYIARTDGINLNISNCSVTNCNFFGNGVGSFIGRIGDATNVKVTITDAEISGNTLTANTDGTTNYSGIGPVIGHEDKPGNVTVSAAYKDGKAPSCTITANGKAENTYGIN